MVKTKSNEWTVNRLATGSGMDRKTVNKILADVAPLREANGIRYYSLKQFIEQIRGSSLSEWNRERFLKLTAERKLAEMTVQKERNQLIDLAVFEKEAGTLAEDFKSDLLAIPDQMCDQFSGKIPREISKMLEDRIWAAMERFGQALKKSKSKLGVSEQKEQNAKETQNTDTSTNVTTNTQPSPGPASEG